MEIDRLSSWLDSEFRIASCPENLAEWAVGESNKTFINEDFIAKRTGLMLKSSKHINKVLTTVFVTDNVILKTNQFKNSLLFTHHNFNYFEDERGLQAISAKNLEDLRSHGNSIYVAHATLDTHPVYGTSVSLAKLLNIQIDELFYDYFGSPTGVFGHIKRIVFADFSSQVKDALKRPSLTLEQHKPYVEKIAVVAGGGDLPDLLQTVYDFGCDTLLTGTVEHRWAVQFIQDLNKKFHKLNEGLRVNLIGGTHFGTERPAMISVIELFKSYGMPCEYCEDEGLLNA